MEIELSQAQFDEKARLAEAAETLISTFAADQE